MRSIKTETINAAKWALLHRLTIKPMQLLYGMVLARFVSPEEMGIIALTTVFFAIATELSMAGFSAALIRKLNRTERDLNTMFWFNVTASITFGIVLYSTAQYISNYFSIPELADITKILSVVFILFSSTGVHNALFQAERDFKSLAIIGIVSVISGMPVCLWLAYKGCGVWALLSQNVITSLTASFLTWKISKWKPKLDFSYSSFRSMFNFGSKLALSSLLHIAYTNLRVFIIGRFYSPGQLGLYSRAEVLAGAMPHTIENLIGSISYPILSQVQNDNHRLLSAYRQYIKISTIPIAYFCFCMASLSYPVIEVTYGKAWISSAPLLCILCYGAAFDHICTINLSLLKVKGKSNLFLRLEIIKKVIAISILIYASTISITAICCAVVVYTQIAIFLNCYYTGRIINLSWLKQQLEYAPYYLIALISTVPAYLLTYSSLIALFQIIIGFTSSFVIFCSILWIKKDDSFYQLVTLVKQYLKKHI